MNNAATATDKSTADRIILEVDWADWNSTLPKTSDLEVLAPAIEAEIKVYIAEGVYPADIRFEGMVHGGVRGTFQHPVIEVSFSNLEAVFDFYTAYCGGDSMQAVDELEFNYGYEAPEGWTPKV